MHPNESDRSLYGLIRKELVPPITILLRGIKVKVSVVKKCLDANDRIAADNRELFDRNKVYVINLMSSPGAGKTSLVERTIMALRNKYKIGVIEGDIQDTYDADRIAKLNIARCANQYCGACHIDGNMIREALPTFDLSKRICLLSKMSAICLIRRNLKLAKT